MPAQILLQKRNAQNNHFKNSKVLQASNETEPTQPRRLKQIKTIIQVIKAKEMALYKQRMSQLVCNQMSQLVEDLMFIYY